MKCVAIVIRQLKKNNGATHNVLEQIRLFRARGYEVTVIGEKLDLELIKKK